MEQSKLESKIETFVNIGSGLLISYLFWKFVIVPVAKAGFIDVFEDTLLITSAFTIISIIRSYYWRRFFARGLHKAIHNIVRVLFSYETRFGFMVNTIKVNMYKWLNIWSC